MYLNCMVFIRMRLYLFRLKSENDCSNLTERRYPYLEIPPPESEIRIN